MLKEEIFKKETLKDVAQKMVVAARTAPKGRGADTFIFRIVEGQEIKRMSKTMIRLGKKYQSEVFIRDGKNILSAKMVVLLGTKIKPLGLKKCGMCGFADCQEKAKHYRVPCVFNSGDLGIAIGSAVSLAMHYRVDNRIMYTAGQAAMDLGFLGSHVKISYAIPLSATSKNPFFDRS
jgi:uncharacterized ferredoxin-like protein